MTFFCDLRYLAGLQAAISNSATVITSIQLRNRWCSLCVGKVVLSRGTIGSKVQNLFLAPQPPFPESILFAERGVGRGERITVGKILQKLELMHS